MRKFFKYSGIIVSVLLVLYFVMPEAYQEKILRKVILPYQMIYAMGLEDDIEPLKTQMNRFYNSSTMHGKQAYIAHGGGVGELHYTNSVEAVYDSLKKGFKFIEIDLLETADGHLVGGHGWYAIADMSGISVERLKKMSLSELKKMKLKGKYSILSSQDIKEIMEKHPEMVLVTDIVTNYELLVKEIPYTDRMIVEVIGGPYFYKKALEAGIQYPAYSSSDIGVIEKYKFPIIVADAKKITPDGFKRLETLHKEGMTILIHNAEICDKVEFIQENLSKTISLIYTNKWYPLGPSPCSEN